MARALRLQFPGAIYHVTTRGNERRDIFRGAGSVGGLLAVTTDEGMYLPTFDANGNGTEYADTNGTVVAHYEYAPFGETIAATGPKKEDFPHRFSTKYLDDKTGLYYYGLRYYSPTLARWLSRDPLGDRAFFSIYTSSLKSKAVRALQVQSLLPPYLFVGNDPINYVDENGLKYGNPVTGPGGPVGPGNPWEPGGPYDPGPNPPQPGCLESIANQYKTFFANLGYGSGTPVIDDKLQHCMSSCELAEGCGETVSWLLGFAKEVRDELVGEGASSEDFLNNFIGHDCAGSSEGCECCCKQNYQP